MACVRQKLPGPVYASWVIILQQIFTQKHLKLLPDWPYCGFWLNNQCGSLQVAVSSLDILPIGQGILTDR